MFPPIGKMSWICFHERPNAFDVLPVLMRHPVYGNITTVKLHEMSVGYR
jgi:hypothetical protein